MGRSLVNMVNVSQIIEFFYTLEICLGFLALPFILCKILEYKSKNVLLLHKIPIPASNVIWTFIYYYLPSFSYSV